MKQIVGQGIVGDKQVRAPVVVQITPGHPEPVRRRRGPYAGAVGYVGWGAVNLDTAIALRTMVLKGQTAYVQAGAGIVFDSVPTMEYEETMNKAMGLLRALEIAETQL